MLNEEIVIVSIARTPIGNLLGELQTFTAPQLGSFAIKAAMQRSQLAENAIDEVLMGCVLSAGLGQAPARQAALLAGLNEHTPCTTISKVCGSGMKSVMIAHDAIKAGSAEIIVAGGMESMSNAPYLLKRARQGYRLGHETIHDHMMLDGLEDAYDAGKAMGVFAETCVEQFRFSRKQQDDYALSSFERAQYATRERLLKDEIIPIALQTKQGEIIIEKDEHPFSVNPEKIPKLNPVFKKNGTVTAGNASSISDGAAALVVMSAKVAKKHGLTPLVKIVGHATSARTPSEFTIAPIDAIKKLLQKINWQVKEVDLFEINEAFAVVAMAAMHELNIPREKLNVHGGAVAFGHPIGASGARILVTLINALQHYGFKKGIASLCIGGGEATAVAVEVLA